MSKRDPGEPITVEIWGGTYAIRGGGDPERLRILAAEVDARMRELAEPERGADPIKVAILAALRIAEEGRAARDEGARAARDAARRIDACSSLLALEDDPAPSRHEEGVSLDGTLPLG